MRTLPAGLCVFALFGSLLAVCPAHADPLNVVVVILDAARADRVDEWRNGQPLMPYLSTAPALRFPNAVSPSPSTRQTIAALFTSLYVDTHQAYGSTAVLDAGLESMATYLKQAGYATLAVQANHSVSVARGFGQGFDQYELSPTSMADNVTTMALDITQGATEPFFLFVHYLDPHAPYFPPESYRTLLGHPDPLLTPAEQAIVEDMPPYIQDQQRYVLGLQPAPTFTPLSAVGQEAARTLYDAELSYTDEQLQLFIEGLQASYPNTLFFILSDHGEHFWEHELLGHSLSLYQPLINVPMFVMGPGVVPGSDDTLVQTVDILPTAAELAGLAPRSYWQGRSMLTPRPPGAAAYACTNYYDTHGLYIETVQEGTMKLIYDWYTGDAVLYDLGTDPGETTDLAAAQPAVTQDMRAELFGHLRMNAIAEGPDEPIAGPAARWLEAGERVELTGGPGLRFQWMKDGQPLTDAPPRVTGVNAATLVLDGLEITDLGAYECLYVDQDIHLAISQPFYLDVVPAGGLPVAGPCGLALLAAVLTGALARRRR